MPLRPGTTFGSYEIIEPIGAGGMGEVYRARDTKLDRDVAIKVLPDAVSKDRERLERFEREAKLLAQLNHPNIATIHGLEELNGQQLLVMELIEGETLAQRIAHGPLPMDEATPIFTQIAEGLEAAHEKGIIHRDLKPANIKITPDGHVKILDFGLAKALQDESVHGNESQSPTRTKGTELGVILGTASYMSPEQARGKHVDKRTDLWAFGCCLYEALTGHKAFVGETTTDTLAAIVNAEPDWDKLTSSTPSPTRRLLQRCLAKNVRRRLTDAGMARLELEEPAIAPTARTDETQSWQRPGVLVLIGLVLVSVTGLLAWRSQAPSAPMVRRVSITAPPGYAMTSTEPTNLIDISPDGQWIAYVASTEDNERQLFRRSFDDFAAQPIDAGDSPLSLPRFSPDSRWLAYYDNDEGRLVRIPIEGGQPETVCETREVVRFDWDEKGGVVLARRNEGLARCQFGGKPTPFTTPDRDRNERAHSNPHTLPNGVGTLVTMQEVPAGFELAVVPRGAQEPLRLGVDGRAPRYLPSGHIVYAVAGGLRAIAFDPATLQVIGESFPVLTGVRTDRGGASFAVAHNGTLIYVPDDERYKVRRSLVWVHRTGEVEQIATPEMAISRVQISPDGKRAAFEAFVNEEQGVWVWDFNRAALTRVTVDPSGSGVPRWISDERLQFESHRAPPGNVFEKAADGTGTAERVFASPNHQVPMSISPDGKYLIIEERIGASGNYDLVVFSYETQTVTPLAATEFKETSAEISPDGRFVAYQSDELGQPEVYVRPFPDTGSAKWPVSSLGGSHPAWSRDGSELFFLDGEGRLSSVEVRAGEDFTAGRPQTILQQSYFDPLDRGNPYDVAPDGTRFLMIEEREVERPTEIHVVLNWHEELERFAKEADN